MSERRTAIITGAARRVGRAIALALADAGYDVAFTYHHSQAEADELAGIIGGKGNAGLSIRADLTEPGAAVDQIRREFCARFNRLDVLVNNASIYEPDAPADPGGARRMWAIHFESPLLLCRGFEKQLRASNGHVINIVDLLAEKPMPGYAAYCASKAALWNLTLSLARELAPQVTVNGVAPGVVEWPEGFAEADKIKYLRRVPLGRAGKPEDVAGAVVFLATQADYITGQILRIDGGRSLL